MTPPGTTGDGHGHVDVDEVVRRVREIRAGIALLTDTPVAIVAVTKSLPIGAVEAARRAGCDAVGENYAQELLDKTAPGDPGIDVHFIGRLQSNKVRMMAGRVDLWQTIDRESLVDEVARRCGEGTRILVQVNATGEQDKGGAAPESVLGIAARAASQGLSCEGLMTVGPTSGDPRAARTAFEATRRLCDDLGLGTCSMGMSGDWRLALECGSTMLRLGTVLFGPRPGREGT